MQLQLYIIIFSSSYQMPINHLPWIHLYIQHLFVNCRELDLHLFIIPGIRFRIEPLITTIEVWFECFSREDAKTSSIFCVSCERFSLKFYLLCLPNHFYSYWRWVWADRWGLVPHRNYAYDFSTIYSEACMTLRNIMRLLDHIDRT